MHASRYNIAVENGSETLLFNTATGAFTALDEAAAQIYQTLEENGIDWHDNAKAQPLVERLAADGFLTDASPEEELAALQTRFEAARHDLSVLTLVLVPTYACNYRCPYCYEQGIPAIKGTMQEDVMDAILRFMADRYAQHPFRSLSVQWYGGDPSLALPQVERLSERMIAFCDQRDVAYDALILTNGTLIDDAAAAMLARCRVSTALLTIDGFEETHNKRRMPADPSVNSFERVITAARLFIEHGIQVNAIMNVDRTNWPEYHALRDELHRTPGIDLSYGRLSDCGHFYGTRDFCKPEFVLLKPEEFAQLEYEEFASRGFDEQTILAKLAAPPVFCGGQSDNYYVIDCVGDVYACDGYIGNKEHVVFNLLEEPCPAPDKLQAISHDPFADPQCRECALLPICLGNCDWERRTDQMQCHPLKTTLPDYLRDLRACCSRKEGSAK